MIHYTRDVTSYIASTLYTIDTSAPNLLAKSKERRRTQNQSQNPQGKPHTWPLCANPYIFIRAKAKHFRALAEPFKIFLESSRPFADPLHTPARFLLTHAANVFYFPFYLSLLSKVFRGISPLTFPLNLLAARALLFFHSVAVEHAHVYIYIHTYVFSLSFASGESPEIRCVGVEEGRIDDEGVWCI